MPFKKDLLFFGYTTFLMSCTEFYWVLLGYTEFCTNRTPFWMDFTGFYRVSRVELRFDRVSLDFTEFYRVFTGFSFLAFAFVCFRRRFVSVPSGSTPLAGGLCGGWGVSFSLAQARATCFRYFCRVVPSCTEFYRVVPSFSAFLRGLTSF